MIISGLLLTLSENAQKADRAEAALRARPEFTLAERSRRWLPVVVEVETVRASRDLHDWLNALPGVDFVDVVQVNFEEEMPDSPPGLGVRQPSGALPRPHSPKRRRAATVQNADAPLGRAANGATAKTKS